MSQPKTIEMFHFSQYSLSNKRWNVSKFSCSISYADSEAMKDFHRRRAVSGSYIGNAEMEATNVQLEYLPAELEYVPDELDYLPDEQERGFVLIEQEPTEQRWTDVVCSVSGPSAMSTSTPLSSSSCWFQVPTTSPIPHYSDSSTEQSCEDTEHDINFSSYQQQVDAAHWSPGSYRQPPVIHFAYQ